MKILKCVNSIIREDEETVLISSDKVTPISGDQDDAPQTLSDSVIPFYTGGRFHDAARIFSFSPRPTRPPN